MAAAEARAVWQRTANRYFIQEDAKRAPKLSCCPSISSVISKIETKQVNPADLHENFPLPYEKSFYSNSSDSKWWIQLRPDYMCQRGLDPRKSHQFVENQDDGNIIGINSLSSKESYEFVQMDSVKLPWCRMAETDDLDPFLSNKSHIPIENYDLHQPEHKGLEPLKIKGDRNACKKKILEALCHSQTRAREAEIAAKKAYAEKEHAIKLVFRQTSQLLAYRQWIYLLQLENICYQIKNNNTHPTSSAHAFSHSKISKLDKNLKKMVPAKGKRTRIRRGFGRFENYLGDHVVVFVVGLGIVGVGLLLGWTVGWMLI